MPTITRVYSNGDRVQERCSQAEFRDRLEYNQTYRPGCALFVGCFCVQVSYLGEERCAEISKEMRLRFWVAGWSRLALMGHHSLTPRGRRYAKSEKARARLEAARKNRNTP